MTKRFLPLLCGLLASFNLLAQDTATKTVRVACVGDSITFGAGINGRETNSYPAQLGRMLGAGYDTRNFGHSGATMLRHGDLPYIHQGEYTRAIEFAPDIVVIMLGTNDSKHRGADNPGSENAPENWKLKADFLPDYVATIAAFRQANPKVKVFVCLPPPCFPGHWGISDTTIHDEVIPLVREAANATEATVIDLNTPLAGKKEYFPDTVHPNAEGATVMATTVYQALTKK
jgi:sialate O-acetylesterase